MTKEQQFKLRSILSIAALLRVTLDWEDSDDTYIILRKLNNQELEVLKNPHNWGGLTVLPKFHTREEAEIEINQENRYHIYGITLTEYKEMYQISLLNSI